MPIKITEAQEHIAQVLKRGIGVLATADATGAPHAATIYFTFDDDFNIYFITKAETTKCKNLQVNARAALAVYEEVSQSTVQVTGTVTPVDDDKVANNTFASMLSISSGTSESGVPPISKLDAGEYVVFKLSPTSMRMASYIRPDPGSYDQIFEFA